MAYIKVKAEIMRLYADSTRGKDGSEPTSRGSMEESLENKYKYK